MIKYIFGELWSEDFSDLDQLICDYQSCIRYCYNRFHKTNLTFNEVRKAAKNKYTKLNTRQISDAVLCGMAIKRRHKEKKVIFGGKTLWRKLLKGQISKDQWIAARNKTIYFRGDKTRKGNPNFRVVGDALRVTFSGKKYINYKLFIPERFKGDLKEVLASGRSYNVRLIRKDGAHFKVHIDYLVTDPEKKIGFADGAIGIDINSDCIAVANLTKDGNLIEVKTFGGQLLKFGRSHKKKTNLEILVKRVVNFAVEKNKGIILEKLSFREKCRGKKVGNRHSFPWKKVLKQFEIDCIKRGIEVRVVNPAFTTKIGQMKYRWMYKVNIHQSAAYVIGRRGLGFKEKLSFYKVSPRVIKELIFRNHAGKYKNQRINSWRLWKILDDNLKAILAGSRVRMADLKEFAGTIRGKSGNLLGETFLQELLVGSNQDFRR